jgi:hypothetical protein
MAPSAGASSRTTSGTASGATYGSPSDSMTSLGTPSGVRGSLTGAGPRAALTTASAAAAPITVAAPEEEDLDKKVVREWKKGRKKGERAGQTEVSKHPCRDIWPSGWSHSEPQTSWPRPLEVSGWGLASPWLLL